MGTYDVLANVTVMQGYKKVVQQVNASFTVVPPDGLVLPQPPSNSKTISLGENNFATFSFSVTCNGYPVPYLSGTPKESFTHRASFNTNPNMGDTGIMGQAPPGSLFNN